MKYTFLFTILSFCCIIFGHAQEASIKIENKHSFNRGVETIEIDWQKFKTFNPKKIVVLNPKGFEIPSQVVLDIEGKAKSLIFQTSLAAKETITYKVINKKPQKYTPRAQSRFVPERLDDYTWENERIAFRTYGPRQKTEGTVVSGIDVWAKRTRNMIIESWYKHMDYHKDHGEGLDFYKVGPTLGSGGAAPIVSGKMIRPGNFVTHKRLNNGPIRTDFILFYDSWDVNGTTTKLERHISIDAGSNLCRHELKWIFNEKTLDIAVGIVKRKEPSMVILDQQKGIIAYEEPVHGNDGQLYDGVIFDTPQQLTDADKHWCAILKTKPNQKTSYWAGAGWNKSGDFNNFEDWKKYLSDVKRNLTSPLIITVK